jgi:hypothetical protein
VARTINGGFGNSEYQSASRMKLPERTGTVAQTTRLLMVGRSMGELGIGLELPNDVGDWVYNSRTIVFHVDAAGPSRSGRTAGRGAPCRGPPCVAWSCCGPAEVRRRLSSASGPVTRTNRIGWRPAPRLGLRRRR